MLIAGPPWLRIEPGPLKVQRSMGGHGDGVLILSNGHNEDAALVIRASDPESLRTFGFLVWRECYALANELSAKREQERGLMCG